MGLAISFLGETYDLSTGPDALAHLVRLNDALDGLARDCGRMSDDIQRTANWAQSTSQWMGANYPPGGMNQAGPAAVALASMGMLQPSRVPILPPAPAPAPAQRSPHRDTTKPPTLTDINPNVDATVVPGSSDRTWRIHVEVNGSVDSGFQLLTVNYQPYNTPPLIQVNAVTSAITGPQIRPFSAPTEGAVVLTCNALASGVVLDIFGTCIPTSENFD